MDVFAAIDVGSNAMRLAIGQFDKSGTLTILANRRAPVRLGGEVFRNGMISAARIEEGVAAFMEFEALLRQYDVTVSRAVATSALRDARNGSEFIERVRRATGILIEIISGDEEARLILGAVQAAVPLNTGASLLVDIGGGSVELSLISKGSLIFSDSVNMGTVRLLEMVRGRKNSSALLERLLRQYATRIRDQVARTKKIRTIDRVIGTGGNIDTLGDLRKQVLKKKNSRQITRAELARLLKMLQGMSLQERIEKLKLRPDRADVIMPAMAIVSGILNETRVESLVIPKTGLRDGVLFDLHEQRISSPTNPSIQRGLKQIRSYAVELGRRYSFDEAHASHAVKLSLQLFDQMRGIHKLGAEERALLEVGTLLHDIGYFVNTDEHHKHSAYIIRESHFVGLTERQRRMVALIARFHRGSLPSNREGDFAALTKADQRVVAVLSGIIRLVEELDREHLRRISKVTIKKRGDTVKLILPSRLPLLVERLGAESRKKALEESLGVTIDVV